MEGSALVDSGSEWAAPYSPRAFVRPAETEARLQTEAPHHAILTRHERVAVTDRRRRDLDTAQRLHPLRCQLQRSDPVAEVTAV